MKERATRPAGTNGVGGPPRSAQDRPALSVFLRVHDERGALRLEMYSRIEDACGRIWALLVDGVAIEALQANGRWLARAELLQLVAAVIDAAPRPVPAQVGTAVLRLIGSKRVLGA